MSFIATISAAFLLANLGFMKISNETNKDKSNDNQEIALEVEGVHLIDEKEISL